MWIITVVILYCSCYHISSSENAISFQHITSPGDFSGAIPAVQLALEHINAQNAAVMLNSTVEMPMNPLVGYIYYIVISKRT